MYLGIHPCRFYCVHRYKAHFARSRWSSAWWPFTAPRPSWVGHASGMVAPGASSFFRRWINGRWWSWMKHLEDFGDFFRIGDVFFSGIFEKCISRWNHRVNVTFRAEFHLEMWCDFGEASWPKWKEFHENQHRQPLWRLEDRLILRQKRGYLSIVTTGWVRFWVCFFFKDQPGGLQTWWNVAGHGLQLVWTHVRGLRIEMSRVLLILKMSRVFFFSIWLPKGWWEYKGGR